jgi:surface polysaccharide O-acyltransferase-like enzyme
LFAPAIQAFVLSSTRRELWFFTCVMFVLSALVRLEHESPGPWPVWFLQYLAYFICGYLIATSARKVSRALGLMSYTLFVTLTAVGCYVVARATDLESGLFFYSYLCVSVIPMSIAAMWLLKSVNPETQGVRQAATMSGLSLGIYLVHPMYLDIVFMYVRLTDYAPAVAVPVLAALTFCVSALLCLLVQRVPLLRRTI